VVRLAFWARVTASSKRAPRLLVTSGALFRRTAVGGMVSQTSLNEIRIAPGSSVDSVTYRAMVERTLTAVRSSPSSRIIVRTGMAEVKRSTTDAVSVDALRVA